MTSTQPHHRSRSATIESSPQTAARPKRSGAVVTTTTPRSAEEIVEAAKDVVYYGSTHMVDDVTHRLYPSAEAKLEQEKRLRAIQQEMYPELFATPVARPSSAVAKHAEEMLRRSKERRQSSVERARNEMYADVGAQYRNRPPANPAEWVRRAYDIPVKISAKHRAERVAADAVLITDKVRAQQWTAAKMIFESNRAAFNTVVVSAQGSSSSSKGKQQHHQSPPPSQRGRTAAAATHSAPMIDRGFLKFEHELRRLKEREEGFRHAVKVRYRDVPNLIGGEVSAALHNDNNGGTTTTRGGGPSESRLRQLATPRSVSPKTRNAGVVAASDLQENRPPFRLYGSAGSGHHHR